ncbi:alpha-ketoglutarate-dependent dioxygenase AlkB [soil metagenome]
MLPREEINIPVADGRLLLVRDFYALEEADPLQKTLTEELQWEARAIKIFGREVMQPRLVAWYGEREAVYTYSGTTFVPLPFTPTLLQIKQDIQQYLQAPFNSMLANLYRNGQDSMGWHSDDEKQLGTNPFIASLSLGEERVFKLRHKSDKTLKVEVPLPHGSLLVMGGALQHHWQHQLPKSAKAMQPRINLTFRWLQP